MYLKKGAWFFFVFKGTSYYPTNRYSILRWLWMTGICVSWFVIGFNWRCAQEFFLLFGRMSPEMHLTFEFMEFFFHHNEIQSIQPGAHVIYNCSEFNRTSMSWLFRFSWALIKETRFNRQHKYTHADNSKENECSCHTWCN